jgi:acyl-lipid omega-6 desaturase (Delta-12 desaturase)
MSSATVPSEKLNWQKLVAPYSQSDTRRSVWQLVNSLVPFVALWIAAYYSLRVSYWLTLLLAIPAAGFLMRAFIIFHDCCHGSFFKSKKANEAVGIALGVLTFTPFYYWRHDHAIHHATAGNLDKRDVGDVPTMTAQEYLAALDKRDVGDVPTMTAQEYLAAPWWQRAGYRILRNPLVMFTIGPLLMFGVVHRIPPRHAAKRELWSVHYTNLAILGLIVGLSLLIGPKALLLVQLPIMALAGAAGVWGFYVQHQFENVYWEHQDRWSFVRAGMQGSSYYKLPALLMWFSGDIGYHHIHHLSPKVPNYRLRPCHEANEAFQIPPLTLRASLKCTRLHLIDDETRELVGWDVLRKYRQQTAGRQIAARPEGD